MACFPGGRNESRLLAMGLSLTLVKLELLCALDDLLLSWGFLPPLLPNDCELEPPVPLCAFIGRLERSRLERLPTLPFCLWDRSAGLGVGTTSCTVAGC